ncbi:hypothetical protein U1Q18_021400 [Sarracenia purpurea var. burkii]
MGLHLVVLVKLNLAATVHGGCPMVVTLVWPYILKLAVSLRPLRRGYTSVIYGGRLFFFQLAQIASNAEPGVGNRRRWERALRLVCQRIAHARRYSPALESDEESFRTLSMLAL